MRSFIAAAAIAFFTVSCSSSDVKISGGTAAKVHRVGERVTVGKLMYTVVDSEWKAELPAAKVPPKNRFLLVRLSIANLTGTDAHLPTLRLISAKGEETGEFMELEGLEKWLGMIRSLEPAVTEEGYIVFDAAPGAYRLEVVDTTDAENEKVALVDLPFTNALGGVDTGAAPAAAN